MVSAALLYLFPGADPTRQWLLTPDNLAIAAWNRPEPQPTSAQIAAAMLPAAKSARLAADRLECQRRIFEYWPMQEQITALAGNYEPGGLASLALWQSANIAASNAARDTINLPATDTTAKVEAVPVAWPVWNG